MFSCLSWILRTCLLLAATGFPAAVSAAVNEPFPVGRPIFLQKDRAVEFLPSFGVIRSMVAVAEPAFVSFQGTPCDDPGYFQKMAGSHGPHQLMEIVRPDPAVIRLERSKLFQGPLQAGFAPLEANLPGHDLLPLSFEFLPGYAT